MSHLQDNKIIPLDTNSKLEWNGIKSKRFDYPIRKHFESKDQLKELKGNDLPLAGRKHFEPRLGILSEDKHCIRTFPENNNRETTEPTHYSSVKRIDFVPTEKRLGHREKLHVSPKESSHYEHKSTIRNFSTANKPSENERTVDKLMGRKHQIEFLDDMRNNIDLKSLGDKSYKNPEYSSNFYKDGGLIAGSSIRERKPKPDSLTLPKNIKFPLNPGRVTWKEKEKTDMVDEEKKAVKELDEWEQTTLKEGNPKWRDPDTFELDIPKKGDSKQDPKNQKKATKK